MCCKIKVANLFDRVFLIEQTLLLTFVFNVAIDSCAIHKEVVVPFIDYLSFYIGNDIPKSLSLGRWISSVMMYCKSCSEVIFL